MMKRDASPRMPMPIRAGGGGGRRTTAMARLTPLPAPVPETLEALLGYEGEAEWLALYVERNFGEVVGDEGNLPFVLAEDAYRLYTEHRAVAPHLAGYDLEGGERPARHRLLLNRQTRTLYVASARAVRARVRAQWPEPPQPPQGAEVGAILAQWTWRLRAEETPAGQAAHARAMATRPRELQGLRSWLDAQAALVLHSQPPEPIAIMARRSLAEVTHDHKEEEEQQ